MWKLVDGNSTLVREPPDNDFVARHQQYHMGHCFDYLRQTIQCHADMTVEWVTPDPVEPWRYHVTGWDIPHQCRKWVR